MVFKYRWEILNKIKKRHFSTNKRFFLQHLNRMTNKPRFQDSFHIRSILSSCVYLFKETIYHYIDGAGKIHNSNNCWYCHYYLLLIKILLVIIMISYMYIYTFFFHIDILSKKIFFFFFKYLFFDNILFNYFKKWWIKTTKKSSSSFICIRRWKIS